MGQLLDKLLVFAIQKGTIQTSETDDIKAAMEAVAARYGTTSDELAKISLIETGGMDPKNYYIDKRTGNGCSGVWQACCLSLDTEILTISGWKYYNEVSIGDAIISYNSDLDCLEVDSIIDLYISPTPQSVIRMVNERFDFIATHNHRWYIKDFKTKQIKVKNTIELDTTMEHKLIRSSVFSFRKDKLISDEMVALLGWVFTDGSIYHNQQTHIEVRINQSPTANPHKCKEIERLVLAVGGKSGNIQANGMKVWNLYGVPAKQISDLLKGTKKTLTFDLFSNITLDQAHILFNSCIAGDGTTLKYKNTTSYQFTQKVKHMADGFQILCTLLGKSSRIKLNEINEVKKVVNNDCYITSHYRICIRSSSATLTSNRRINYLPIEDQLVWCPQTNNKTWIARREGHITITGNSSGGLPEVGYSLFGWREVPAAQQWAAFPTYLDSASAPYKQYADFSDPVTIYACNLLPSSIRIQDDNANLHIPAGQATALYEGGIITRHSIREGLIKNAATILHLTVDQVRALAPGTKGGKPNPNVVIPNSLSPNPSQAISQGLASLGSSISSAAISGQNCTPPPYNQFDRIIYAGCNNLSPAPLTGNAMGTGYAAPAINSLTPNTTPVSTTASPNTTKPYDGQLKPGGLIVPMKKGTYSVSSGFGIRIHPVSGKRKPHRGIDLAAPKGTPIYAAADGIAVLVRSDNKPPIEGYGHAIKIQHANGLYTLYGHTSVEYITEGSTVKQGQLIAGVGTFGLSTGFHLHFEVRPNDVPVDPTKYLSF